MGSWLSLRGTAQVNKTDRLLMLEIMGRWGGGSGRSWTIISTGWVSSLEEMSSISIKILRIKKKYLAVKIRNNTKYVCILPRETIYRISKNQNENGMSNPCYWWSSSKVHCPWLTQDQTPAGNHWRWVSDGRSHPSESPCRCIGVTGDLCWCGAGTGHRCNQHIPTLVTLKQYMIECIILYAILTY